MPFLRSDAKSGASDERSVGPYASGSNAIGMPRQPELRHAELLRARLRLGRIGVENGYVSSGSFLAEFSTADYIEC